MKRADDPWDIAKGLTALAEHCEANSESLQSWFDSVFEQRTRNFHTPGLEETVRDAFQMANRTQVSLCALADHMAKCLRAILENEYDD